MSQNYDSCQPTCFMFWSVFWGLKSAAFFDLESFVIRAGRNLRALYHLTTHNKCCSWYIQLRGRVQCSLQWHHASLRIATHHFASLRITTQLFFLFLFSSSFFSMPSTFIDIEINELTKVGSDQRSSTIQYDSKSKHSNSKRRQSVNWTWEVACWFSFSLFFWKSRQLRIRQHARAYGFVFERHQRSDFFVVKLYGMRARALAVHACLPAPRAGPPATAWLLSEYSEAAPQSGQMSCSR